MYLFRIFYIVMEDAYTLCFVCSFRNAATAGNPGGGGETRGNGVSAQDVEEAKGLRPSAAGDLIQGPAHGGGPFPGT